MALELHEKMQLLSGGRNPAESSGRVHWEQLVCVWVRRDREPGHGGEQEPRSSLLHG